MVLGPSLSAIEPGVTPGPPLSASRSAPLPKRESLLPPQFEGLTDEQAFALALAMYLQDEKNGRVQSEPYTGPIDPFAVTNTVALNFEKMPTYPVEFTDGENFIGLVRAGTPKEVYNFRQLKNKKQFALYYALLSDEDKATYWDKYTDYQAEQIIKHGSQYVKKEDVTPRALEKYMDMLSNEEFERFIKNDRRLPNSVLLSKGKHISRNRMTRKNRANIFRQKYVGTLAKSARTKRAAGLVPPPYVPKPAPPPRRLGVPEPEPEISLEEQLLGYTDEEKAEFRQHVMNNAPANLEAYLATMPRETITGLFKTLNNSGRSTLTRKRTNAALNRAKAAAVATNAQQAANISAALPNYIQRLAGEGPIEKGVLGTRKNVTARYLNTLSDEDYARFIDRVKYNALGELGAALPLMKKNDRRANLVNKMRKAAFLGREQIIKEQQLLEEERTRIENEQREAQEELEQTQQEQAEQVEKQRIVGEEIKKLERELEKASPDSKPTIRDRIVELRKEADRLSVEILKIGTRITNLLKRIRLLGSILQLGGALLAAGTALMTGGVLGFGLAAYQAAKAAYYGAKASQEYKNIKSESNISFATSKSEAERMEDELKKKRKFMTINNIDKLKIEVDVSLELEQLYGSFTMVGVRPTSSKYATAKFGKHEVKIEDGKFIVYIYDSKERNEFRKGEPRVIKREIPIPTKKAIISGKGEQVKGFKTQISHSISLSSSALRQAAEGAGGAAAAAAQMTSAGKGSPWLTISYDADVYVDTKGQYYFYFLNKPVINIPLALFDNTWY